MQQTRIRTQPHFAQPASAALRPSGYICAAQLLLSRSHLVQQAAFGACSGSMHPGRAATLRYMPLTRYECFGRPHNPVHFLSRGFAFGRVWSWRFAVGLLAQRLDAPSCTASRRYIPLQSTGAEEPSPARHCCSKEEELQQCRSVFRQRGA